MHDDLRQQHELLQRWFLLAVQSSIFLQIKTNAHRVGEDHSSEICEAFILTGREQRVHLRSLVHLGDHGVDHVVGVADERASIAVPPLLAVHGFPPGEHDVEV